MVLPGRNEPNNPDQSKNKDDTQKWFLNGKHGGKTNNSYFDWRKKPVVRFVSLEKLGWQAQQVTPPGDVVENVRKKSMDHSPPKKKDQEL